MNDELMLTEEAVPPDLPVANHKPAPPADAKQMRIEQVGALLGHAYQGASTLKLTSKEIKELTADFDDSEIEIRPFDGIIYLPHMILRQRLWSVFGPMEVAEICRERMVRNDSNEIAVDLVLMVRGVFVAEGIGTAKYYPKNANASFGDTIESAWSDALRRCCKKISVGVQVWRPGYVREWVAKNAVQFQGKWYRKDDPRSGNAKPPSKTTREYTLKEPTEFQKVKARATAAPEGNEDDQIPF